MNLLNFKMMQKIVYGVLVFYLMTAAIQAQNPISNPRPTATPMACPNPEIEETIGLKIASDRHDNFYKCSYKTIISGGVGSKHEPPIGAGGGSMFFDIPSDYLKLNENGKITVYGEKYRQYKIVKTSNPDDVYQAISDVLVMTEEVAGANRGEINLWSYNVNRDQNARLKLWLKKDEGNTHSVEPDIVINGRDGGSIISRKKIKHAKAGKNFREDRFVRSKKNLRRVIKWQMVSVDAQGGEHDLDGFGGANEDLYYFYIRFYHPVTIHQ